MTRTKRIVLDTNVLVSGLGWSGPPAELLAAAQAGRCQLVTTRPLLEELRRVLDYPKLRDRFPEPDRVVALIAAVSEVVDPPERLQVVADEPDNRVLEAAVAGDAAVVVSGDAGLLALGTYQRCRILGPAETLAEVVAD